VEYGNYFLLPKNQNGDINSTTPFPGHIIEWGFDVKAFRELGGKYIVSVIPLAFPEKVGLTLKKAIQGEDSYWDFWLYEVL